MGAELFIVLGLILINGFFSLSEMAVVSSRKARLKQRADDGHKGARLALDTAMKPGRFLSTIQIVITLVGTIAGAFGGATIAKDLEATLIGIGVGAATAPGLAFGIIVVLTTILSVVIGELVPKNIALSKPEAIASVVIFPLRFFSIIFSPIVRVLSAMTDLVLRIFGIRHGDEPPVTEEEVKVLIAQGTETGIFDDRERAMFEGVLYLGDRKVTTFMTPRTEIVYVDASDEPSAQAAHLLEHSSYSNLPLAEGNLDHIRGMIRTRPVVAAMAKGRFSGLDPFVEKPILVPESMSALDLFTLFRETGGRVAVILDEYGGAAGMVTFSDLAEAILGEAMTSGQKDEDEPVRREDGSWLMDGSLSIDDLAEIMDVDEDELRGDYETVAGFVLDRLGTIPRAGERFSWDGWSFEVMDMDGNRVDKVLAIPPAQSPEENQAEDDVGL